MRAIIPKPFTRKVVGLQEKNRVLTGEAPKFYAMPAWAKKNHKARVKWLRDFAEEYAMDPRLRWFVVDRVLKPAGVKARDFPAMAKALLRWVQTNIYYTMEAGEQLQSPWRTLDVGTGDCDDSAILLAAMAASVGLPNKFVLAGRGPRGLVRWVEGRGNPPRAKYFHIYCLLGWPAGAPRIWAPAEQTLTGAPLGYDLVLHGVNVDAHGRPSMPQDGRDYLQESIEASRQEAAQSAQFLGGLMGYGAMQTYGTPMFGWPGEKSFKEHLDAEVTGMTNRQHYTHIMGAIALGALAMHFKMKKR